MKNATSKTVLSASWDSIFTAFTAAKRSGNEEALSAAKATVRAWHDRAGASIPSWAW